jgi:hypothetical protein
MSEYFFFYKEFNPRLKPREFIQIRGEYYEVTEVRPMFPWTFKLTELTDIKGYDVDLKERGLKGGSGELLDVRIRVDGPVKVMFRIEGAGGPVLGGFATYERFADENTSENLIEALIFEDKVGWLYARIIPIIVPAWCRLKAEGYVYKVRKTTKPQMYTIPAYISE